MRRIDRIRSMSVYELADALLETGLGNYIDFCRSKPECSDYMDEYEDPLPGGCRECLVKWLMEEG